jgi:hypothetical protein
MKQLGGNRKAEIENLLQKGDSPAALPLIQSWINLEPEEPAGYRFALYALEDLKKTREIQQLSMVIKKKFPNSVESAIADALESGLYLCEKKRRLLAARKLDPQDPFLCFIYAKFCYYMGW